MRWSTWDSHSPWLEMGQSRRSALNLGVLGRVQVWFEGPPLRMGRAKSLELLVYLAMHPEGADAEQLWEALWPYQPMSPGVLHTTVSVARRSLREHAERPPLVSDARDGRLYRLDGSWRIDWHHFVQLAEDSSRHRDADAEGPALAAALDLVRGAPFTTATPASYEWALGHRTEIEAAIGSVAERLGHLRLAQGDVFGARQAARRGLLGAPYDQRLYRLLMRAADASANPGGVEAVMLELTGVLGYDRDAIEPETWEFYLRLRRRSPRR